jgi:hypothetical protein
MNLSYIFITLAVLFYCIGTIPYFYHIFRANVVPHPFSWTVWCIFSLMNGYILYQNYGLSILHILVGLRTITLCVWAIIGWYNLSKISIGRIDIIALVLAIGMIFVMKYLWLNEATLSMILIDFLVLIPTLKKIWINPRSEDSIIWLTSAVSFLFFVLSFPTIDFANAWFWIYVFLINCLVALLVYRRTLYLSNWKNILKKHLNYFALKKKLW